MMLVCLLGSWDEQFLTCSVPLWELPRGREPDLVMFQPSDSPFVLRIAYLTNEGSLCRLNLSFFLNKHWFSRYSPFCPSVQESQISPSQESIGRTQSLLGPKSSSLLPNQVKEWLGQVVDTMSLTFVLPTFKGRFSLTACIFLCQEITCCHEESETAS